MPVTPACRRCRSCQDISPEALPRFSTGFKEFDRVLGGGVVPGSAILIGGNPGAGKSTLLLQTLCKLAEGMKTLYVTGEESCSGWRCAPIVSGCQRPT